MRCQAESGIADVLSPLTPTWSRTSSLGIAGEAAAVSVAFGSTTDAVLLAAAMQATR